MSKVQRFVSLLMAMVTLVTMISIISVGAYTDTRLVGDFPISHKNNLQVVAQSRYALTFYSNAECFEANHWLDYLNVGVSDRNFSGYTELTIEFTNNAYDDLVREGGYIFTDINDGFPVYGYIPNGRVWSKATAWFQTNITAYSNNNVYNANPTYGNESRIVVMTNP